MTSGGKKHGRLESRGNIYWLTNSVVDSDERLIAAATGCDVRYDYVVMKQVMFMVALRCKPMFPMFVQVPQNFYKLCNTRTNPCPSSTEVKTSSGQCCCRRCCCLI